MATRKQVNQANRTVERIHEWAETYTPDLKDDQPASRNPFAVNSSVNRWLRKKLGTDVKLAARAAEREL